MLRRLAVASFALTAACAGQQKTGGDAAAQGPTSTEERVRITNQPPFDLVACFPREAKMPAQTSQGVVLGALLTVRPQVQECLVDPKNRGPAPTTKLQVKTTVTDAATTHAVTGENLTPEGTACIQKLLDTQVQPALLAKGAAPVEATIPFEQTVSGLNSVTFGINEGSDFTGAVRLGLPTWCDCYANFKAGVPPTLTAKVKLVKAQQTPSEVTFEPSGSTEGDQVAACLQQKMMALPAKLTSDELGFAYRFVHFNSGAPETAAASLTPELRFLQMDLVRTQRAADAAMADGARAAAAQAFAEVVERYQKTKNYKLFDELESKCNALVAADGRIVETLQARQQTEQAALTIAQEMKTKDAEGWTDAEAATQKNFDETVKEIAEAQKLAAQDKAACPKKSYK
ncbi:hypothetical protein HPC49_38610 [Pyxidicoccus fallax]|uniref:Lipoprotein n=1 Tax=Pyxidicoccus fallax TaxID=394095 RepID=A0A848LBL2_9BACT|nr:hypothetical protein [Pyxidicoccus fallax]NMO16430.1 hypothetical protein [Pyxidicoccus fallax]NPC84110.1 hypothetical protein [Pyxidicoccus fallax]